jgi:hypothetical protein
MHLELEPGAELGVVLFQSVVTGVNPLVVGDRFNHHHLDRMVGHRHADSPPSPSPLSRRLVCEMPAATGSGS